MSKKYSLTIIALALSVTAAFALSGCGSLLSRPDPLQIIVLQTYSAQVPQCSRSLPAQIIVPAPHGSAGLNTDRIAILLKGREVNYMSGHRWEDSPSSLIQRQMVDAANESGCFQGAGTGSMALNAAYRLEIDIKRMHYVYTDRHKAPVAEVRLLLSLIDVRNGLLLGQFEAFAARQAETRELFVAMEEAVHSAIGQSMDWLPKAVEEYKRTR